MRLYRFVLGVRNDKFWKESCGAINREDLIADRRLVRASVRIKKEEFKGTEEVLDGIVYVWVFADADLYRAATHDKGIMNGVSAMVIATENDFRAIEAGAHSYASRTGRYSSLTHWEKDHDGNLIGTIELPMAVGLIGGATKMHPLSRLIIKILGVKTATELGEIIGTVGLCRN